MVANRISAAFVAFLLVFGAFSIGPATASANTPEVAIDFGSLEPQTASLESDDGSGVVFTGGVFSISTNSGGNGLETGAGTAEELMDWAATSHVYHSADEDYMFRTLGQKAVEKTIEEHAGYNPISTVTFTRQDGSTVVYQVSTDGTIQ